jgi:hypothetical protein
MAVFKSSVGVHDAGDRPVGVGMAYVHLRLPAGTEQRATGTVSLREWEPTGEGPFSLRLEDGRRLPIEVSLQVLSDCSSNHILRFQASWPPLVASPDSDPAPPV